MIIDAAIQAEFDGVPETHFKNSTGRAHAKRPLQLQSSERSLALRPGHRPRVRHSRPAALSTPPLYPTSSPAPCSTVHDSMSSPVPPEDLMEQLIAAMEGQESARLLALAGLSCLVYDMFLTLGEEVRIVLLSYERCSARTERKRR